MADRTVDDELKRQLEAATPASTVGAVFTLRSPDVKHFLSSEETQSLAKKVIAQAAKSAGAEPHAVQVFGNLQSFALKGSRALMYALIEHPQIETAMANEQTEDIRINPID